MPPTRRTQLLMEPGEFRKLQAAARRRRTSVAELIRSAVREAYLSAGPDRGPIVEAILAMGVPRIEWKQAKKEIESGHADVS
jgi:hypothetical protein